MKLHGSSTNLLNPHKLSIPPDILYRLVNYPCIYGQMEYKLLFIANIIQLSDIIRQVFLGIEFKI